MNKDFALIQKYYLFELSDKELTQFKRRIEEDKEFADYVIKYHRSQKEASKYCQSKEELERKERWKKMLLEDDLPTLKKKQTLISTKWLVAASVILLVGTVSLFNLQSRNDSGGWEKLVAEGRAMSPDLELTLLRGEVENQEQKLFKDAYDFYLTEDYETALYLFKKVPENDTHYKDAVLLEAISYYRLGAYKRSLTLLNSFEGNVSKEQHALLLFYKSLNYLEQKEIGKAKITLEQVDTSDLKNSSKIKQFKQLINQYQSE